jgi:hypothetical protein
MKAFGDVAMRSERDMYRANVQIIYDHPRFLADILGPFGGSFATFWADAESLHMVVEDRRFDVSKEAGLSGLPFFRDYAISFEQLIRILTGRVAYPEMLRMPPDSSWMQRRKTWHFWDSDSVAALMRMGRSRRFPEVVVYESRGALPWRIELKRFIKLGIARQIRLETPENNYFSLNLQDIRIQITSRSEK